MVMLGVLWIRPLGHSHCRQDESGSGRRRNDGEKESWVAIGRSEGNLEVCMIFVGFRPPVGKSDKIMARGPPLLSLLETARTGRDAREFTAGSDAFPSVRPITANRTCLTSLYQSWFL